MNLNNPTTLANVRDLARMMKVSEKKLCKLLDACLYAMEDCMIVEKFDSRTFTNYVLSEFYRSGLV